MHGLPILNRSSTYPDNLNLQIWEGVGVGVTDWLLSGFKGHVMDH